MDGVWANTRILPIKITSGLTYGTLPVFQSDHDQKAVMRVLAASNNTSSSGFQGAGLRATTATTQQVLLPPSGLGSPPAGRQVSTRASTRLNSYYFSVLVDYSQHENICLIYWILDSISVCYTCLWYKPENKENAPVNYATLGHRAGNTRQN